MSKTKNTNEAVVENAVENKEKDYAYYDELVTVKLFKDNGRYKDDVFVAVNGVGMLVPRGVDVQIPRKYAEVLKYSEEQDEISAQYMLKLQESYNSSELSE